MGTAAAAFGSGYPIFDLSSLLYPQNYYRQHLQQSPMDLPHRTAKIRPAGRNGILPIAPVSLPKVATTPLWYS